VANLPLDSSRTLLAMGPAAPRIKDAQTGEVWTDRSGSTMYEVQLVMPMDGGPALSMMVAVPETGLAAEMDMGSKVKAVGLMARTGVGKNGKEYVMFNASALTVLAG
jgi:hypothetical protein